MLTLASSYVLVVLAMQPVPNAPIHLITKQETASLEECAELAGNAMNTLASIYAQQIAKGRRVIIDCLPPLEPDTAE